MSRGKLVALILLGVGLVALLARRAQAASAPPLYYYPEQGIAPEPSQAPQSAPFDWGSLFTSWGEPTQQASASQAYGGGLTDFPLLPPPGGVETPSPTGGSAAWDIWETPTAAPSGGAYDIWDIPTYQAPTMSAEQNVAAFLALIRRAEGTEPNSRGWNPYGVTYGYAFEIRDFSRHPALLGWAGGKLPDEYCRAAGFAPGCVSTAAGAYQFNLPTWQQFGSADFSPLAQDQAAIRLLDHIGALAAIRNGDLQTALDLASTRWASLPGSTSRQPQISIATAEQFYQQAGGITA